MVVHMRDHLGDAVLDPLFLCDVAEGAPATHADVQVRASSFSPHAHSHWNFRGSPPTISPRNSTTKGT